MSRTDRQTGPCARVESSEGVIVRTKGATTVTEIRLGHCREETCWREGSRRLPEDVPTE